MRKLLSIALLLLGLQSYGQRPLNKDCKCHLANIPDSVGTRKQLLQDTKLVCDNNTCEIVKYTVNILFLTGKKEYYGPYTSTKPELPTLALRYINQDDGPFRVFITDIEVKKSDVVKKQDNFSVKIKD